jgi:hypothetical protein
MAKTTEKDQMGFNRTTDETVTDTPGVTKTTQHGRGTRTDRNFTNTTTPNTTRTTTETPNGGGGQTNLGTKKEGHNLGFRMTFSIPLTGTVPTNC